ncbi:MAG: hypothetical protein JO029_00290 [Candidatus Eremiobacteraeota bacterium]|nr:hypothetical protein [Candidatus Eremiobacteraeota bacterium]
MENYVAIVFENDEKAYEGLHALWKLDATNEIEVKGAAVVHRGRDGYMDVATKDTDAGLRTAIGIGLGALLGALAGPIGAATAAAAATGMGVGAAAGTAIGGMAGLTGDLVKADEREQALHETRFVLPRGKSAVIAEVSEEWTMPVDALAKRLGGIVHRRSKDAVRNDEWDLDYATYLYPEDYAPVYVH